MNRPVQDIGRHYLSWRRHIPMLGGQRRGGHPAGIAARGYAQLGEERGDVVASWPPRRTVAVAACRRHGSSTTRALAEVGLTAGVTSAPLPLMAAGEMRAGRVQ